MGLMEQEKGGRLLYVLADGKLREKVEEGTDGAKLRVVKDDDGTVKAEKWELTYPGITGFITGVSTYDGDYGTNINIAMKDENDEEFVVSLNSKSKYGEDFLHKLPKVDFAKEISLKPYNFTAEGDRKMAGITMIQSEEKLTNAFNWKDPNGEWQSVDGYPQVDEKKKPKNSDQWMVFFTQRREWLIEHLTEKGLLTTQEAKAEEDF